MLTVLPPVIAEIKGLRDAISGAPIFDAFERAGEPVAVRHLCQGGVKALLGTLPPYLSPTQIDLDANYADPSSNSPHEPPNRP